MPLKADSLFSDPKIKQATQIILSTLKNHQTNFNNVKKPLKSKKITYEKYLHAMQDARGGSLWYPYIGSGFGNGALVELLDGSVKYDFINGIGAFFGHSLPKIVESGLHAAIQNTVMQGNLQQNKASLNIMQLLTKHSGMDHCFLTSSGVMANENALKIIFQHKAPANRILVFERCFMGRTLAVSQLTDNPNYREGLPLNINVDYIPFFDENQPEESTEAALKKLIKLIKRYPNKHAGMSFELVQGEGGYYPGSSKFFIALMKTLKEHNIPIMVDEVQTFGRTESLFAYQHYNLEKYVDIVTCGKLSQVCATMYKTHLKPKPGLVSQTFTSSTTAIEAANVIINELIYGNYFGKKGKNNIFHSLFKEKLSKLEKKYPQLINGPFGIGAMIAFTVFKGEKKKVIKFSKQLFQNGIIGFIAGENPTRMRFLLPMGGIKKRDVDNAIKIIEKTLMETQ